MFYNIIHFYVIYLHNIFYIKHGKYNLLKVIECTSSLEDLSWREGGVAGEA